MKTWFGPKGNWSRKLEFMANQTGPTSTNGKLASCMNNFRHGGAATSLFLPGEDQRLGPFVLVLIAPSPSPIVWR